MGETVYNRDSGRTELNMAVEAANRAIADAGLVPQDIDGIVKFTADSHTPRGNWPPAWVFPTCGTTANWGRWAGPPAAWSYSRRWPLPRAWSTTCWCIVRSTDAPGNATGSRHRHHPPGPGQLRIHRALRPVGAGAIQRTAGASPHARVRYQDGAFWRGGGGLPK